MCVCDEFNLGNRTIKDISEKFKLCRITVSRYLVEGTKAGICSYDKTYNDKRIKYNGEEYTISEWCNKLGLKYITVQKRYNKGWSAEECLKKDTNGNAKIINFNGEDMNLKSTAKLLGTPYTTFIKVYNDNGCDIQKTTDKLKKIKSRSRN